MYTAKHEAGHATTSYALRLSSVAFINLKFKVIPHGNLFQHIRNPKSISLKVIRGVTSVAFPSGDTDSLTKFGGACFALGGIAGCDGDGTGADGDVERCSGLLASIGELDRAAIEPLQKQLQILAFEIIRDSIISLRHGELARRLSESQYLDQTEVEKILVPASLPDYSPRLAEMAKKFNIGKTAGKRRSFSLSELPL